MIYWLVDWFTQVRREMNDKFLSNPDYNYEKVYRASTACGPMVKWVIAQLMYAEMLNKVLQLLFLSHFDKKSNLWFPGFFIVAFLALVALGGLWLVFVRIRTSKCYTTNGGHQYENDQSLTYTIKSQIIG